MKIFSVDPGLKGGLAYLSDGEVAAYTLMPSTVHEIVTWFDHQLIRTTTLRKEMVMIVELAQSMPGQGAPSVFNYGRHFGIFETYAACCNIKYHEVRPAKWKKEMGLNAEKINSIKLCQRLFPLVNLIPEGCKKPKDGIAEAILIGEWFRRTHK